MVPIIVKASRFRAKLAEYMRNSSARPVLIEGKQGTRVLISEDEYNMLITLREVYSKEDPEGEYKESFVKEMLKRKTDNDVATEIKSLTDLL